MLDIGWTELLVIAIVLIVVVGPKDLPPMLRAFGKMTTNLRKMAGEFRTQFDEAIRESELDDVKKTISDAQRLNPTNALRDAINPLRQMGQEIRSDLRKATQIPTASEAAKTDVEAQQAVEGTVDSVATPEIPAPEIPATVVAPASGAAVGAKPVQAAVPAPAASPLVSEPVATVVEKPKAARKSVARPKSPVSLAPAADDASIEKPKRSRAKPVIEASPAEQKTVEVAARKRSPKTADTPKDDA